MATETISRTKTPQSATYLRRTKIPTLLFPTAPDVDRHVALVIESLIRENNSAGLPTVLGLATGSTPIGVYRELIRLHREEDLDFSQVVTFNLDEYWPMDPGSIHSYHRFMHEHLFDHINIDPRNIHIPSGTVAEADLDAYCDDYERQIEKAGGIDLQILGIGRTGHIGFNEPGSPRNSRTRIVQLDPVTRRDAASDFFGEENVPFEAMTMGVGTILSARKIIIMALGEHKANIVRRAVEGEISPDVTASFLQSHPHCIFTVDDAAAGNLTSVSTPWLVGHVNWTGEMERKAVIWLSQRLNKPLLKLENRDFLDNHLHELLHDRGPIDAIRQRVFQDLLAGICTQPAGTESQRVILFSPHPDDDVISMGGTMISLADQGHDVRVAYMTSGNIAVFDHDALRHIDFVEEYQETFGPASPEEKAVCQRMRAAIAAKSPGDPDSDEVLNVKGLIRKTEAAAAAATAGVPPEKLYFLDLPFYRTGKVSKRPIGEEDVRIIADLLRETNPGQIYVAGDLSDPHGTHRMCARAIILALDLVAKEGIKPEVWLYRGAWEEYEPHEIDRVVPLSPETTLRKRDAIFKHESQKDRALYPGSDEREFWVRADARTRNTARIYNELGLPEFFALEGFKRFLGQLL
ncbi:MAG: glucosamine-6-phosphate deaminase [Planctomycetota bacterium]|nr:glucosamine-6-phosphate deaminase [Planctomycetota bacterium]MDA1214476.1 glucosamine-6-phosphate deaminase [Planctomycetota bacterium]